MKWRRKFVTSCAASVAAAASAHLNNPFARFKRFGDLWKNSVRLLDQRGFAGIAESYPDNLRSDALAAHLNEVFVL